MFQKTNHAGYEKDVSSNFTINTNTDEYKLYVKNREKAKEFNRMVKEVDLLKKRVETLESQIKLILNSQSGTNG